MKSRIRLSIVVMALFVIVPSALATTWYVNGVSGSNSNKCLSATTACKTIGHAISLAHSGDSIIVAAATYAEQLTVPVSLRIIGANARTTIIDAQSSGTVIGIFSAGLRVTLASLTIRGGSVGGVRNAGTLTITNCTISGNSGAGVSNAGTLRIFDTTISGNRAFRGGGVSNGGTLELVNSTIEGNAAAGFVISGGRFQVPRGGGIYNVGTSTISNSTIADNTAIFTPPVGICHLLGPCYEPGMDITGPITIEDSIVTNEVYGHNCSGVVNSRGYNLSSDSTCNFNNSGDRNNIDPMLGPLQYNGGPTQTMALISGSPAIDAGNPGGCVDGQGQLLKTDQRGMPRPDTEDKIGCDMGAYERQSD